MIKPTIGRVVWFFPHNRKPDDQPHSAQIAFVHDDRTVNLGVLDKFGNAYAVTSVPLLQDDDAKPATGPHAEWMPYQVGQAAKNEADDAKSNPATSPAPEGNHASDSSVQTDSVAHTDIAAGIGQAKDPTGIGSGLGTD
jgi:hypothetical protein